MYFIKCTDLLKQFNRKNPYQINRKTNLIVLFFWLERDTCREKIETLLMPLHIQDTQSGKRTKCKKKIMPETKRTDFFSREFPQVSTISIFVHKTHVIVLLFFYLFERRRENDWREKTWKQKDLDRLFIYVNFNVNHTHIYTQLERGEGDCNRL